MTSEKLTVRLKGKCEWAQVFPGQERAPHAEAIKKGASLDDRAYSITVECSDDVFKKLRKAGLNTMHNLKYKEDDSGWLTIKGTKYKANTSKGAITFEDPIVIDNTGERFNKPIGNGSQVIVTASLEQAGQSKALRLKGVQVVEHIPYEPKDDSEVLIDVEGSLSLTNKTKPKDSGLEYSEVTDDLFS